MQFSRFFTVLCAVLPIIEVSAALHVTPPVPISPFVLGSVITLLGTRFLSRKSRSKKRAGGATIPLRVAQRQRDGSIPLAVLEAQFEREMAGTRCQPQYSFNGIEETLDDEQKSLIRYMRHAAQRRDFSRLGSVLLDGPRGTGKTVFAHALAQEANMAFFNVSPARLVAGCVGDGALRVRALLRAARKHAPAMIFVDSIDALGDRYELMHYPGGRNRMQTIGTLDGLMEQLSEDKELLFVAATDMLRRVDCRLRQKHFFTRIRFELPTIEQLDVVRERYCSQSEHTFDDDIVWPYESSKECWWHRSSPKHRRCGISFRDLERLMKRACSKARASRDAAGNSLRITQQHVNAAWDVLFKKYSQGWRDWPNPDNTFRFTLDIVTVLVALGLLVYTVHNDLRREQEYYTRLREQRASQKRMAAVHRQKNMKKMLGRVLHLLAVAQENARYVPWFSW